MEADCPTPSFYTFENVGLICALECFVRRDDESGRIFIAVISGCLEVQAELKRLSEGAAAKKVQPAYNPPTQTRLFSDR